MPHWLLHILGADNANSTNYLFGSGLGGMLLEVVVIGGLGWLAKRLIERLHTRSLAQAAAHHRERIQQAADHHVAVQALAQKHHLQALDHASGLHEQLKAHLTAGPPAAALRKTAPKGSTT